MATRVLRYLPKDSKEDEKTYLFRCEMEANSEEGYTDTKKFLVADTPQEAKQLAKDLVLKLKKKKKVVTEALLHDARANLVFHLRRKDIEQIQ